MPWATKVDGSDAIWLEGNVYYVVSRDGQTFVPPSIPSTPTGPARAVTNLYVLNGKLIVEYDDGT